MAKQLINLRVDEISLVDKGANQGAHIVFFKALDGAKPTQNSGMNGGNGMTVEINKQLEDTQVALAKALDEAAKAKDAQLALEKRLEQVELSAKKAGIASELAKYSRVALSDKDKVVKVLLTNDTDTHDVIKELLTKLDKAMESARVFETIGSSAPASDESNEFDALVAKRMDQEPGLTIYQARAKVYRANPALASALIKGSN